MQAVFVGGGRMRHTGTVMKKRRFEIAETVTTHILYLGGRVRDKTVVIRMGSISISRKAAILGLALALCQLLDGLLTYFGLALLGMHMEANVFLRELMHAYGKAPVLFTVKTMAVAAAAGLTLFSHRRRWFRWVVGLLICVYLALALIPWVLIIYDSMKTAAQ